MTLRVKKVLHYLRGQIFWCAAERFGCVLIFDSFLAKAKVGDFDVAILIQQQIFQLKNIG